MKLEQNIILIGHMGAGKSTVGHHLSKEFGVPFFDTDHVIEDRTGATISWIFDVEGEEGFRQREHDVIDELTQQQGVIIATGGGAVLWPENRTIIKQRGLVVYLKVELEVQIERTKKDTRGRRPLLRQENRVETLVKLHQQRDPLYQEIADITISTDEGSINNAIKKIIEGLEVNHD